MKKLVLAALAVSITMVSAPVLATTYTGAQQLNSIFAEYTIITDGVIGNLKSTDITSFSVSLSDGASRAFLTQNIAKDVGDFSATPASLFTNNAAGFFGYNGSSYLDFQHGFTIAEINDVSGHEAGGAFEPNNVAFATVIPAVAPAVPEPATWAMMIVGFGAVGLAIRRRQEVRTTVRFA